ALVDVSFIVDTGGQSINAVNADVLFPADKLQVVNPAASTSFISLWVTAPTYSNTDGTINLQGGLPNPGIKTSAGVISTVTFRIKAAGPATIRYAPSSKVLLNDGQGTNILSSTGTASFVLSNPPPAGPIVASPTHPSSNTWSNNPDIQLSWEPVPGAIGYSYSFDQIAKNIPDDTVDTTNTSTSVHAMSDGIWYFHIKAKNESWGGISSYQVEIDTTPPAAFTPTIDQKTMTTEDTGTLRFITTDAASGIDHFEVKQISQNSNASQTTLFVEASSPYVINKLPAGGYSFVVRALDRAGNSVDGSVKLDVISSGLPFYARVPILRNPAVANAAVVTLAGVSAAGIGFSLLRRFRLRSTFTHDLKLLEHDAQKKYLALQREMEELQQAQQLVNQSPVAAPAPTAVTTPPPMSPPPAAPAPPLVPAPPQPGAPPPPLYTIPPRS
ncbi:MAG: hypothetical protein HY092_03825, partial [Candidatus Kerfeldbacteria bacterium]|nr:hypothetical protein [Candidatus Kerfeldbacteria bacterium]